MFVCDIHMHVTVVYDNSIFPFLKTLTNFLNGMRNIYICLTENSNLLIIFS